MVFHSAAFLFAFLPVAVVLHRLMPGQRARAVLLGLLSLVFLLAPQPNKSPAR